MHSIVKIIVAAGMILPCFVAGQETPSASQSTATMPKSRSQKSPTVVNGKAVSTTGSAHRKPQKVAANEGGSNVGNSQLGQTASSPSATGSPKKIVVRQGGVREPSAQIVTDMDPAEATRRREDSERLLNLADENLKRLADRSLNEQQQETVLQIDHYMVVARSALKEGDISRGHTLALKASLLAADIARH